MGRPRPAWETLGRASAVASIDRLSGGRVVFGTGPGDAVDYEPYGRASDPSTLASRLDESLGLLDAWWRGESDTHDDDHFTLEDAAVRPTPVQEPRVPICSGAWWPKEAPFRRGARWDDVVPSYHSLTGEDAGPHGEEPTGSPLAEARASLEFYHEITDDPVDVLLPELPGADVTATELADLGVTWRLTTRDVDSEPIEDGPLSEVGR